MEPAEQLLAEEAVAVAPERSLHGSVWRTHWKEVTATDWSLSIQSSGRYHRGLDLFPAAAAFPALYTSLAPEIAIWELVRRSAARNLAYLQNNVLSELKIDLSRVLDLSEPSGARWERADLTGPDFHRCQEIAAAAVRRGYEGILVPSAALPGSNLVILPGNLRDTASLRLVQSTALPLDAVAPDTLSRVFGSVGPSTRTDEFEQAERAAREEQAEREARKLRGQ